MKSFNWVQNKHTEKAKTHDAVHPLSVIYRVELQWQQWTVSEGGRWSGELFSF